jgi:hypothetical protein
MVMTGIHSVQWAFVILALRSKRHSFPLRRRSRRFVGLLFGFFRYVRKEVRRTGNMVCTTNYLRSH